MPDDKPEEKPDDTTRPPMQSVDEYVRQILAQGVPGLTMVVHGQPVQSAVPRGGWTEEEFRQQIGAAEGRPVAPGLEQISPYLEGTLPISRAVLQSVAEFRQAEMGRTGRPEHPDRPFNAEEDTRELLRYMAAGIQFAYEQQPWEADRRLNFNFDTLTVGPPAYVNVPFDNSSINLRVTTSGIASVGIRKTFDLPFPMPVRGGRVPLDHKRLAFFMGGEEGRHIAQNLVAELRDPLKAAERAHDAAQGGSRVARDAENPLEREAGSFADRHFDAMQARFEQLPADTLPPRGAGTEVVL